MGIRYGLGKGGKVPSAPTPDENGKCDCTGFAAWVIGISRVPKASRNWWLESTNIYRDAVNDPSWRAEYPVATFVRVPDAEAVPGCFLVAPDGWFGQKLKLLWPWKEGHIMLVSKIDGDRVKCIDCSGSRGVSERDGAWMLAKGGIFVVLAEDRIRA